MALLINKDGGFKKELEEMVVKVRYTIPSFNNKLKEYDLKKRCHI